MSFRRILAGETVKALTLRPLRLTVVVGALLFVAYALADAPGSTKALLANSSALAEGVTAATTGLSNLLLFAPVPILIGVFIVSSEYTGGQLAISVLAVPARGRLLAAKLIIAALVNAVLAVGHDVIVVVAYQIGLGPQSVLRSSDAFGAYAGRLGLAVVYWVLLGVVSSGVAVILRSQAVALALMVLLAFAGMALLLISPMFQYLPTVIGMQMFNPEQALGLPNRPSLGTGASTLVLAAWALAATLAAGLLLRLRDVGGGQVSVE
ncbi:hypothetical protein [uncultured Propionibacterium sp.]|uniref:hypothetical protein n=1 Tax=uncultured Propionibacterium sp. TaxID=218066 RepID=UPI00292E3C36|nr:hypothetical protein [uncultured Propionibacterium sp.]